MPPPVIAVIGNATRDINRSRRPRWVHRRPGGSLLYCSCALTRMGLRVRAIGYAPPGAYWQLRQAGVETHFVSPTWPNPRFMNRYHKGHRTQLASRGPRLKTRHLIRLGDADGVMVVPVLGEVLRERMPRLPEVSLVDIQGYVRALGPPSPFGWRVVGGIGTMTKLDVPAAHIIRGSTEDIAAMGLSDPEEAVRRLEAMAHPGGIGVVTLGDDGALVSMDQRVTRVAPIDVDVSDPTGAGDVFEAGIMAALVDGREPVECLAWGNAAAGLFLSSSQSGEFIDRFPSREAVEREARRLSSG